MWGRLVWLLVPRLRLGADMDWMEQTLDEATVEPTEAKVIARAGDPETSKAAARAVSYRTGTQKARLLRAYANIGVAGLTDEEAAQLAGIGGGGWKRCSDLRNDGMIVPLRDATTGTIVTRIASSQMAQRVCVITDRGMATLGTTKDDDDRSSAAVPVPHGTYADCPGCGRSVDVGYYHLCRDCGARLR